MLHAIALLVAGSVLYPGATNRTPHVTVIGDSITRDWPMLMMGQGHFEMHNKFASGAVANTCYAQWKYNTRDYDPDVVVMLCGINDMKNNSYSTPAQAFYWLEKVLNEAYADGVELWVLSVMPAQYRGMNGSNIPLTPQDIIDLNALLSGWVASHPGNTHYVDIYSLFLINPSDPTSYNASLYDYEIESRDSDGNGIEEIYPIYLHPSAAGDLVIAEALLDAWGW